MNDSSLGAPAGSTISVFCRSSHRAQRRHLLRSAINAIRGDFPDNPNLQEPWSWVDRIQTLIIKIGDALSTVLLSSNPMHERDPLEALHSLPSHIRSNRA